jgi:peptidoglycan/LPS O-acetylase OafA/YrhL
MAERRRLWALDGLRGLAALAVVAYHYLDRGPSLYSELGQRHPWLDWGRYGVQLFFIISGFVIFNSVRGTATRRFFANRAIRLYPAYWVAVILTFTVVLVFGLPGRETSAPVALMNLTMLEGFFGIPYVDGAYWTLAIELTFYVAIALLARTRALADRFIFVTLFAWLAVALTVRTVGFLFNGHAAIDVLAGIAYWMPVFLIGIALNIGNDTGRWLLPIAVIVTALIIVAPGDLSVVPPLTVATLLTVGAIYVKLPERLRPTSDYLGELSYPVYLVHQNIGYVILLALVPLGIPQFGATAIAAATAIALATVISYSIDIPVRRRLRALVAARSRSSDTA